MKLLGMQLYIIHHKTLFVLWSNCRGPILCQINSKTLRISLWHCQVRENGLLWKFNRMLQVDCLTKKFQTRDICNFVTCVWDVHWGQWLCGALELAFPPIVSSLPILYWLEARYVSYALEVLLFLIRESRGTSIYYEACELLEHKLGSCF